MNAPRRFRAPPAHVLNRLVGHLRGRRMTLDQARAVMRGYRAHPDVWEAVLDVLAMPPLFVEGETPSDAFTIGYWHGYNRALEDLLDRDGIAKIDLDHLDAPRPSEGSAPPAPQRASTRSTTPGARRGA